MFSGVNKYIYSHTETRERKNEAERSGYGEFARPCTQAANEYRPDEKSKNVTLLETYQIADVVKLLAGLYSDGG